MRSFHALFLSLLTLGVLTTARVSAQETTDRAAITSASHAMRGCVEAPGVVRVSVRASLSADGRVTRVVVSGPVSSRMAQCIEQRVRPIRFAARRTTQTLSFPVVFHSDS